MRCTRRCAQDKEQAPTKARRSRPAFARGLLTTTVAIVALATGWASAAAAQDDDTTSRILTAQGAGNATVVLPPDGRSIIGYDFRPIDTETAAIGDPMVYVLACPDAACNVVGDSPGTAIGPGTRPQLVLTDGGQLLVLRSTTNGPVLTVCDNRTCNTRSEHQLPVPEGGVVVEESLTTLNSRLPTLLVAYPSELEPKHQLLYCTAPDCADGFAMSTMADGLATDFAAAADGSTLIVGTEHPEVEGVFLNTCSDAFCRQGATTRHIVKGTAPKIEVPPDGKPWLLYERLEGKLFGPFDGFFHYAGAAQCLDFLCEAGLGTEIDIATEQNPNRFYHSNFKLFVDPAGAAWATNILQAPFEIEPGDYPRIRVLNPCGSCPDSAAGFRQAGYYSGLDFASGGDGSLVQVTTSAPHPSQLGPLYSRLLFSRCGAPDFCISDAPDYYDPDQDGVPKWADNCPDVANPEQADRDDDRDGDACDINPDTTSPLTIAGTSPSLVINDLDNPVVAYVDSASRTKVMVCSDRYCEDEGDSPGRTISGTASTQEPRVMVTSDGHPAVLWEELDDEGGPTSWAFTRCSDRTCSRRPTQGIFAFDRDLHDNKLDQDGLLVGLVAPRDEAGSLLLVSCLDQYCFDEATSTRFDGVSGEFAFDASGNPSIIVASADNRVSIVACNDRYCTGDDEAVAAVVEGAEPKIEFGTSSLPIVSYARQEFDDDGGTTDTWIVHCADTSCSNAAADEVPAQSNNAIGRNYFSDHSLHLDRNGAPWYSYQNFNLGDGEPGDRLISYHVDSARAVNRRIYVDDSSIAFGADNDYVVAARTLPIEADPTIQLTRCDSGTNFCGTDSDGDLVPNWDDNCVDVANSDQADTDANGVGDACADEIEPPPEVAASTVEWRAVECASGRGIVRLQIGNNTASAADYAVVLRGGLSGFRSEKWIRVEPGTKQTVGFAGRPDGAYEATVTAGDGTETMLAGFDSENGAFFTYGTIVNCGATGAALVASICVDGAGSVFVSTKNTTDQTLEYRVRFWYETQVIDDLADVDFGGNERRVTLTPGEESLVALTGRTRDVGLLTQVRAGAPGFVWADGDLLDNGATVIDCDDTPAEVAVLSSCSNDNGRFDIFLRRPVDFPVSYEVVVEGFNGFRQVKTVILAADDAARSTTTARPDGAYTISVTRAAGLSQIEVYRDALVVSCDPVPTVAVSVRVTCLNGQGRIDLRYGNITTSPALFRSVVESGTVQPRERVVPAQQSSTETYTSRPNGSVPITVSMNGIIVYTEVVTIDC